MNNVVKATLENFNEVAYLLANPDIGFAVMNGELVSGYQHFVSHGIKEHRNQMISRVNQHDLDYRYLGSVPISNVASHANQNKLIKNLLFKGAQVLEVGSRCVTSQSMWLRNACHDIGANYVGFDYYQGSNVDVSGDAHYLANYFNKTFDIIYSSAVFEHFAMPWQVAPQIAKLLSIGGHLYIETHFSFKSHERPWHFFQFSDMALRALFSPALGIECIEAGVSNPIVGRFSFLADEYLKNIPIDSLYCHSEFFGKKVLDIKDFSWDNVDMNKVTAMTQYPNSF